MITDAPLVGAEHIAAAFDRINAFYSVQQAGETELAHKALCASADLQITALAEIDTRLGDKDNLDDEDQEKVGLLKMGVLIGLIARDLAATAADCPEESGGSGGPMADSPRPPRWPLRPSPQCR